MYAQIGGIEIGSTRLERVVALMRREKRIRYAGGALGYAWAYLTPVAWISFIVVVFQILDRRAPVYAHTSIFVATGILPYILFRQTVTSMMRALQANRYTIYFRPTSVSEILVASALIELLNTLIMSVLIFGSIVVFFDVDLPADAFKVATGMVTIWFLGAGFGRLAAILARMSDTFLRAVPILMRPLFWVSGIFFVAAELPYSAQEWLWFSPLFHPIEIVREGFFLDFTSPISSYLYPIGLGVVFFLISASVEKYWRQTASGGGTL